VSLEIDRQNIDLDNPKGSQSYWMLIEAPAAQGGRGRGFRIMVGVHRLLQ
jgi:hypothetical protein